jgi:hypothetical protein
MDDNPRVSGPDGTLTVGTLQHVQWTSIPGSLLVDLDLLDPLNGLYVPLIQNLPDFGSFNFLVPSTLGAGASVRVSFKSSPTTVITQAGAEAPDLSPYNGSFETGSASPWLGVGGATIAISSSNAYGGVYSLAESGAAGGVYQDITGLTPGQFYRVTARALSIGGGSAALFVHDTLGSNSVLDGYRVPSSTSFDEFAVNFQADPTGQMRIHLLFSGGTGTVYWDQVQIMPAWQSDFENGSIAPWLTFGAVSPSVS